MANNKKRDRGVFVRLPDELRRRMDEECEYLSITRNAWLTTIIDKELRNSFKERALRLKIIKHENSNLHLEGEDIEGPL